MAKHCKGTSEEVSQASSSEKRWFTEGELVSVVNVKDCVTKYEFGDMYVCHSVLLDVLPLGAR